MQHTTLHTTVVQSPSHNQRYIHISKLPEFIPTYSKSGYSCISISIHTQYVTLITNLIH